MTNNYILIDENIIPMNPQKPIIFKKTDDGNYSIDIIIDIVNIDEDGLKNLSLSIYSLITIDKFPSYDVATSTLLKENNKTMKILSMVKTNGIKTITHYDFIEGIRYRLGYDEKYVDRSEFYSFRITYEKFFLENYDKKNNTNVLTQLKPKYPGNNEVQHFGKVKFDTSLLLTNIKKLKDECQNLKKQIKTLEQILNENKITHR